MTTKDSVTSPRLVSPPKLPTPQRHRAKLLLAPLFGLSLVLHGLLLLAPAPAPEPVPEAEDAIAEDEFVDLLSIGTLAPPEPEVAPAPAASAPPPLAPAALPTQAIAPPPAPIPAPADPVSTNTPSQPEPVAAEPPPATAVVADEAVAEIFTRLTRGSGDSDFDSTETSFPAIAYLIPQGIAAWSPQEQACFFTQINADTYSPQPSVVSLRYLTRNVQFIEQQDIPRTFPAPQYAVNRVADGYCDRPLFQVFREGQPYLFISLVGIGVGAPGQQASGLVIIWASDPRSS
ncbi:MULTISPECIES: hypothetical protein [Cyanophyceae]|uniref:hypothetical protein n=1 Tax=Cyanophyceae TaxID=3028117 RepID=UPI001685CEEB|nr:MULTISPECIES: hypothetical protein [Cyanophyceae]MBD1917692.1 hypothetical protein [Phormidium sp. FACHB-77]MBD2031160.1 hypothetical protein [Phormidium sp. FACHB-322]MBD2053589.1 hypothetical protein [Leptolyngbya sp. FACHB-60]